MSCSALLRCLGSRLLLRFRCCRGLAGCSSYRFRLVRRPSSPGAEPKPFGPLLPGFLARHTSHAVHDSSTCCRVRPHAGQRRCCTWKFGLRPGLCDGMPAPVWLSGWAYRREVEVAREFLGVVEDLGKISSAIAGTYGAGIPPRYPPPPGATGDRGSFGTPLARRTQGAQHRNAERARWSIKTSTKK
jgi:hypothetical protein